MFLLIGAFLAGILTVLAPCVLPLLPVIIGGSISGDTKDRRRPVLIAVALAVSLLVFTLLLKVTTVLIHVPQQAIVYFSGGIVVVLGILTLFPNLYLEVMGRLGLEHRALALLGRGEKNSSDVFGPIITGAALGPVFSSCSPVYAYILATVLPAHFAEAFIYMIAYVLGLALVMLAIGSYGQKLVARIRFASNPTGSFQRGLGVIFMIIGILIITGTGTKLQTYVANHTAFDFDSFSAKLLPASSHKTNNSSFYNVASYKAPEFTGIQGWINSNPLTLQQLKGKVVLVDFWTYTCINCIRTLPYTEGWYTEYKDAGLVVIGVEAPEFSFEKVPANVAAAVKSDKLTYPIAIDGNLATWNAYQNEYWPAEYLIDKDGNVRRQDFGEGNYQANEKAIRSLLLAGTTAATAPKLPTKLFAGGSDPVVTNASQTPETYLGANRQDAYVGSPDYGTQETQTYTFAKSLEQNQWSLSGSWEVSGDEITARGGSKLRLNFASKNVYIVADAGSESHTVGVNLNGQPITNNAGADVNNSQVVINQSRLYTLASFPDFTTGTLELDVPDGTNLNVFTFGN